MSRLVSTIAFVLLVGLSGSAWADWQIDPAHSRVGFSVRHMMVSNTKGEFTKFSGVVQLDDKQLQKSQVTFELEAASVDTRDAKRDEHLRSPDFFDVAKHPKITFASTRIQKAGKNKYKVTGNLSLHGVTKPVTVDVVLSDPVKSPWGFRVRGVKVEGEIDRKAFGITWNKALDAGGFAVGDTVSIDIDLELKEG